MALKLKRNTLVGIKSELVQGTLATVTTADYIVLQSAKFDVKTDMFTRDYYRGSLDGLSDVPTTQTVEIELITELRNSSSLGYPVLESLIRASTTATSSNAAATSSITPISIAPTGMLSPANSVTINYYEDGIKRVAYGVIGSAKLAFEVSKPVLATFSLKGNYSGSTDTANPTPVGLVTSTPPICQAIGLTLGAYTPIGVNKMDIDFGVDVQRIDDMNAAKGVYGFIATGRKPVVSFGYIVDTLANHDAVATLVAGTTMAVSAVVGTTGGNTVVFSMPYLQITNVTVTDRNGILAYDVQGKLVGTGNDAFSLKLQ